MKKIIPVFTTTLIFTITIIHTVAQKTNDKPGYYEFKNQTTYVSAAQPIPQAKNPNSILYKINMKAVRDFMTTYPNITNEKWEILKDGYIASFVSNSVWVKNYYDKKGRWLHSIQQYDETKLPKDIRASVKSIYYDYIITLAREFNKKRNNDEPLYFVHIKYGDAYKTIRVFNNELQEMALPE